MARLPANVRWWRLLATASIATFAVAGGCNLNPQPLPPEAFDNSDGGQSGTSLGSDSGTRAQDASIGPNGGGAGGDGGGVVDGGTPPAPDADAGDAGHDLADGSADGGDATPDGGAADAPSEGG